MGASRHRVPSRFLYGRYSRIAGTDRDSALIQALRHIVSMRVINAKTDNADFVFRIGRHDRHSFDRSQPLLGNCAKLMFVIRDLIKSDVHQVFDCSFQSN